MMIVFHSRCFFALWVAVIWITVMVIGRSDAQDWPHWMGPARDNSWRTEKLIQEFPPGGPPTVWKTPVAGGYSGPAVAAGKLVITDYVSADDVSIPNFDRKRVTGVERVHCLDQSSGEILWTHQYPTDYKISYPAGPRCTPIIEDSRVYTLGAEGMLICLELNTGEVVWEISLTERYQTTTPLWGYAAHPLIDGDRLITLAGGDRTHVVALDKHSGKQIWSALTAPEQGYSPPTIIQAAGTRQLILAQPDAVTSVNPIDGSVYWELPYDASNGSIIMSPVQIGKYLYVAGFNRKSVLIELSGSAEQPTGQVVLRNFPEAICPVNVQPTVDGDVLYGFDQNGELAALSIPEGKRLWATSKPVGPRRANSGTAFIVPQAGRYWMFNELGELLIARLSATGFEELDRAKVIEPTSVAFGRRVVWSMPALSGKHAYIRNDKQIICVDLGESVRE